MTGVFSLMAVFYITRKKFEIQALQKLLTKSYKQKQKIIDTEIENLATQTNTVKGKTKKFKKKLDILSNKKKTINKNTKKLKKQDLKSAVDTWFNNR
jgi:uncharacterized protein (DUF3084 family)